MRRTRREAERAGRMAEVLALWFLRFKGYRLLARRYKCPAGEIDLVMRRGETVAFIEVKARASHDDAVIAVTRHQSRRIAAAAKSFMGRVAGSSSRFCRFDIVTISPYQFPRHIENAFYGD